MKLITTPTQLRNELLRLIDEYPNIALAVAWASFETSVFGKLLQRQKRINQAVIGTHFFQTDPRVLDAFVGHDNVRFILQPNGVFHPKIYFFWDAGRWELLIGSANLTAGALGANTEVVALLSHHDDQAGNIGKETTNLIHSYWSAAAVVDEETASRYRNAWKQREPMVRRLAGFYGQTKAKKQPLDSSVLTMTWDEFVAAVHREGDVRRRNRLELLDRIRSEFQSHRDFGSMDLGARKTIAGLPTPYDDQWGWFGSMKGAGYFHGAVNDNNRSLSLALNHIPAQGQVTQEAFEAFVQEFQKAFPNGGHGVAPASRLLAMKRPDQFVCVDSKNRVDLCNDFGIRKSNMTYVRYWSEIIERVRDSPWWNSPRPERGSKARLWDSRAAMLDAIFYNP